MFESFANACLEWLQIVAFTGLIAMTVYGLIKLAQYVKG
jgi:hypothetical protein